MRATDLVVHLEKSQLKRSREGMLYLDEGAVYSIADWLRREYTLGMNAQRRRNAR